MSSRRSCRLVRSSPVGVVLLLISGAASAQVPPVPGPETNMVSGRGLYGGDPFLQRQNEPSMAVSSENAQTLLAAANDYRAVDIPNPIVEKMVGDAWMGIFKSFNGGQTWQSVLLPGYPQDQSPEGLASPLKGFAAAADPVVRAGTDGLFYVTGITFNRGTNRGQTFVARFIDLNDKQNGDPTRASPTDDLRYVDTRVISSGTAGQFVDKPWSAVDIPRSTAGTCTFRVSVPNSDPAVPAKIEERRVRAGNVYFVYATFTGSDENASSVQFTRSVDCGQTWSKPLKLSESTQLNQGAIVAVDPVSGAIFVAWRRFRTSNAPDAILFSKSTDYGLTFSKPATIATVAYPFDQGTISRTAGGPQFRTTALPAIAVSVGTSAKGKPKSWVHVAWAQRSSANAESRIVVATSETGTTWSAPIMADPPPATGWIEDGTQHGILRGHQLMPAMTFTQGRLMLLHYDTRLTHTRRFYKPTARWESLDPENETGPFFSEELVPLGELLAQPDFYKSLVNDNALEEYRHTIEVRAGSSAPGATPAFATTLVSRHRFGQRGDEGIAADGTVVLDRKIPGFDGKSLDLVVNGELMAFQDLAVNPPNLPLFANGTSPFIGDYIDIAGQNFVRLPAGGWGFNTAPNGAPVHHAIWTSNQDVRAPRDGDWSHYTPIRLPGQTTSVYDGSSMTECSPGQEGMRNQNVYTSRLSEGLVVSSPQNTKPLSSAFVRAFVVTAENTTDTAMTVQLAAKAVNNVTAMSFRNDGSVVTSLAVRIPPRVTAARTLFVKASVPNATVTVDVAEMLDADGTGTCVGGGAPPCLKLGGYAGSATLNPPGSVVSIAQPDGSSADVNAGESFGPLFVDLSIMDASVRNASVRNGDLENASVRNASVRNASVRNETLVNPDLASVRNASVRNASVRNGSVVEESLDAASVRNASVRNGGLTADPVSDASYVVRNDGNTTMSYRVKLVGTQQTEKLTLVLLKHYATPAANPDSATCELIDEQHPVVMASVRNASVRNASVRNSTLRSLAAADAPIADPEPEYADTQNATFFLAPGEIGQITIRGAVDLETMRRIVTEIAPVVIAHGVTDTTSLQAAGIAVPLLITTDTIPAAQVGVTYNVEVPLTALQAIGATAPLTWTYTGALPAGLTLTSSGRIVGTPQAVGSSTITVTVTDASGNAKSRALTVTVEPGTVTLQVAPATRTVSFGQPTTFFVMASAPAAGPAPSGTISLTLASGSECGGVDGNAVTCGFAIPPQPVAGSPYALTASYSGDSNYVATDVSASLMVDKAVPAGTLGSSSNPAVEGTLTLTATVSGGATGFVQFQDGGALLPNGRVALVNGSASYNGAALPVGSYGITVYYEGDGNFLAGPVGGLTQQIAHATSTAITTMTPDPSLLGADVLIRAKVARSPDPLASIVTTGLCSDCHMPHNPADPPGPGILRPEVQAIVDAHGSPIFPAGAVEFYDVTGGSRTFLGTDTAVGHGSASFNLVGGFSGAGSRELEAVFVPGDPKFLASASPAASHEVTLMTMNFQVAAVGDGTLELHAILNVAAGAGVEPTGVVLFTTSSGNTIASDVLCETPLLCSAPAIVSDLVPGDTVTAVYEGDGTFAPLTSAVRVVPPYYVASTAVTGPASAATNANVIVSATLTPVAAYAPPGDTPRGLVDFYVDGTYVGARDVVAGAATYTFNWSTAATYQITARYHPQNSSFGAYADWYVATQPLSTALGIVVSSPPAPPGGVVIVP